MPISGFRRLQIPIADFAPKALVPESLHDESIVIPSEEFCHDVNTMERSQEMRAAKRGIVDDLPSSNVLPPKPARTEQRR
jgi:hypothetical protein